MFKDDIDNSNNIFIPKLKYKYNSKIALDVSIIKAQEGNSSVIKLENLPHPYQYEIENLTYEQWMIESRQEIIYKSLEATPITFVDSEQKLTELATILDQVKEIAIDLEAHDYRTYQGLTCLMQISTRQEDFVIDTLSLRNSLYKLNSSFTNPKIVKVFHGGDMDIQWLQRDFGIYVVNMFDSGQAARVLDFPSYALSYLLKFYCGIIADKQYQKSDWRVRPLPDAMFKYAREDTHYLLYIYDRLRNEALQKNGITTLYAILNRSRDISLKKYQKEIWNETSYENLLFKLNPLLTCEQINVFAAIYNWRDQIARQEDESTRYVLPNHMILEIANKLPEDDTSLLKVCNPTPSLVKMNILDILNLIKSKSKKIDEKKLNLLNSPVFNQQNGNIINSIIEEEIKNQNVYENIVDYSSTQQLLEQAGWVQDKKILQFPQKLNSVSDILLSNKGSLFDQIIVDDEEENSDNDNTHGLIAESVKKSLSLNWFTKTYLQPKTLEKDLEQNQNNKEQNEQNEQKKNFDSEQNFILQSSNTKNSDSEEDLLKNIPKSINEIYKLSNKIKKRKSNQVSDPSLPNSPDSPFFLKYGQEEKDIRSVKKIKNPSQPSEFMNEIGWETKTPKKKQVKNFIPYDYSQHKEERPISGESYRSILNLKTTSSRPKKSKNKKK